MDIPVIGPLQAIFDQAAVGISQISLDGAWLLVNNRYCQMLGYSEAELRTKTLPEITHPDDYAEALAGRHQLLEGVISSHTMEKRYIRKDGTVFWGRLHRSLVRDRDNVPRFFIAVVEDITQKKEAERALRDSEQRLALATNAACLGLWDCDLRTGVTVISGEYAKLHGLGPDHLQLTHENWLGLIHPDDRERLQVLLRESIETTRIWEAEFRVVWPDGTIHWLLGKGQVYIDDSGRPVRMAGVSLDITDRKRAEEQRLRLASIVESCEDAIFSKKLDGTIVSWNSGAEKLFGYTAEEIIGKPVSRLLPPERLHEFPQILQRIQSGAHLEHYEVTLMRRDGRRVEISMTISPIKESGGIVVGSSTIARDITERKQAAAALHLESIGVLASGIAHDFNNMLGGILAEAELAAIKLTAGESPIDGIQRISTVASRGAEIVRQLMIYSGQDKADPVEGLDLSQLVEEMLELLKVSISKHAVLKTDLHQDLPAVRGRASQIRQIVMNLIINASEAVGEKGGVIRVTTSRIFFPLGAGLDSPLDLPTGDYVKLEVSDTGGGMTEEVQAKVFDPFFTTKFAGRGLGLAVVQGIVRDHGGAINLVSAPAGGTTFGIFLPCIGETAHSSRADNTPASGMEHRPRSGTVLMVEDEDVLRVAVSRMLRKQGFRVIEAGDGSSALELIHADKDEIEVVLLDVTLPGVSSREVFAKVRQLRPNLKVILTSAYSQETVDGSFAGEAIEGFIRKPFRLVDLVSLLRHAVSE